MNRSVAEIAQEALQLPVQEKYTLARVLLESAEEGETPEIAAAWEVEIERRIALIDAGQAKAQPFSQALREVDMMLSRK